MSEIKQKVLIVDDEPRNQRIVAETLEDLVDFKIASTGDEALKAIDAYIPDLILLDIMMPGIGGFEVCQKVRSRPEMRLTKIIFVSGKAMLNEKLQGYEMGADDYMTKPFMPEELLAKTKVFLRLARLEREMENVNNALDQQVQERTRQLMQAEAMLINAAKFAALGEMAGGIAHEINTPLAIIGLTVEQIQELLQEGSAANLATISEMSKKIGDTVQRISSIVQGLKTFSRDGSNDRFEATPLKQIIENTLVLCQEKLKTTGVKMNIHQVPDDLKISCQAVQISQVLLNLINNSCDAINLLPEKWIDIAVKSQGESIEVLVTDSGPGIPEKVLNKLFQPFFTTKEVGKGTGLGLSISKGIVETHHGTLSIDSSCKNTRFVLKFPISVSTAVESLPKVA